MAHDIICTATNRMLIAVGTMLMENRATLLPTICSDFNQHAKDLTAAQGIQEPPELKSISSRWILSEITCKNLISATNPVFLPSLPWRPECCMLEGMFIINTTPLGSHKLMSDYAKFLITRFVMTQFKRGCHEVHIIFDNPGRLTNTPKYFKHKGETSQLPYRLITVVNQ